MENDDIWIVFLHAYATDRSLKVIYSFTHTLQNCILDDQRFILKVCAIKYTNKTKYFQKIQIDRIERHRHSNIYRHHRH